MPPANSAVRNSTDGEGNGRSETLVSPICFFSACKLTLTGVAVEKLFLPKLAEINCVRMRYGRSFRIARHFASRKFDPFRQKGTFSTATGFYADWQKPQRAVDVHEKAPVQRRPAWPPAVVNGMSLADKWKRQNRDTLSPKAPPQSVG